MRDGLSLQVELQTPGQHSHRQLLWIRRSQEKLHMRRGLLERLQQRVKGVRQSMCTSSMR